MAVSRGIDSVNFYVYATGIDCLCTICRFENMKTCTVLYCTVGFATDGEVKRQLESLLGALDREATRPWRQLGSNGVAETTQTAEADRPTSKSSWRAEDPSGRSYRLMQYNPPYTLPWLRTNSVAVRVVEVADSGISSSSSNTGAISRTTGARRA